MKKEGILVFIISIALIKSISAASFGIGELFDSIDSETMILGCLFVIFTLLLKFALGKFLKDKSGKSNETTAGILSIAISLLMIYGIYKSGIDLEGSIYGLGIDAGILSIIIPVILIIGLIYLAKKFKLHILWVLGLALVLLSFTDLVYEKGTLTMIGLGLIILFGIIKFFLRKKKPKIDIPNYSPTSPGTDYEKYKKEAEKQRERADEEARKRKEAEERIDAKRRGLYDLKQKYMAYLYRYYQRGQSKHTREQIIKAMNIIIEYAKRQGCSKGEFLSNRIGSSNAKAPEQLRPPFDD